MANQPQLSPYKKPPIPSPLPTNPDDDNKELLRIKSLRILDIFPDELVVHQKNVSLVRHELLLTTVETLPINNIVQVARSDTFSISALTIMGRSEQQKLFIRGLPKLQAQQAKELIEKLMVQQSKDNSSQ